MTKLFAIYGVLAALLMTAGTAVAPAMADDNLIADRVLGKADAPIVVDEYVSLTCSHCAEFYNDTLPALETKYVDTGKVRFVLHDFPLDGVALKAAQVARCMPADEFYPFVKVLYKNQMAWATSKTPEKNLTQYAMLGGLGQDKAQACLADTKLQDAIVAERTEATEKHDVQATPTFIINKSQTVKGAQSVDEFSKIFDDILQAKK
jgi:protein-disulfide isomerase